MKAIIASVTFLVLVFVGSSLGQTSVTIESVTNVQHDTVLAGNAPHTVTLRYNLTGAPAGRKYLTANGFRIYSPDGADWGSVQGAVMTPFSAVACMARIAFPPAERTAPRMKSAWPPTPL